MKIGGAKMNEQKLESILDTARKMFGRYGIQKTNLNEIARLARVAKATIYNYFGSKDQVYLEVLQREVEEIISKVKIAVEKGTCPMEKFRAFVYAKFRSMKGAVNIVNLGREGAEKIMPMTEKSYRGSVVMKCRNGWGRSRNWAIIRWMFRPSGRMCWNCSAMDRGRKTTRYVFMLTLKCAKSCT